MRGESALPLVDATDNLQGTRTAVSAPSLLGPCHAHPAYPPSTAHAMILPSAHSNAPSYPQSSTPLPPAPPLAACRIDVIFSSWRRGCSVCASATFLK